jgi:hypothetical protein
LSFFFTGTGGGFIPGPSSWSSSSAECLYVMYISRVVLYHYCKCYWLGFKSHWHWIIQKC